MKITFALTIPFALASCVHPATPAPAVAPTPVLAREIACDLADRVGPRLAGSAGDARAVAWAVAKMKELGLANVHTEPVTVPHWERGAASGSIVADGIDQPLAIVALGGSVGTPAGGIEAEVIEVGSLAALDALAPDAAKGKIVFFNKPMTRGKMGFGSYGTSVDVRGAGAVAAAKHGALASIVRSIGTSDARFPHTGGMRYADGVAKVPGAAIAVPDAEMLHRLLAKGVKARVKFSLETRDLGTAASSNVVGEVRGRETPDEIVLIGAHLDSWDLGRGAIDDGAGVGVVLDVAHTLLAAPPKRTVRVILFANEENGLAGARAYAAAHMDELAKHQAVLEIDEGSGKAFGMVWSGAASATPLFAEIGERLKPLGVSAPVGEADAGGADTIPIRAASVPSLEILQDGTRYFDVHHTADDTCEQIDAGEIAQLARATLLTTSALADAPALLERTPAKPAPSPSPTVSPFPPLSR